MNRKAVDYKMIRQQVTPRQVLEHFGWRAVESGPRSCRGPCPFHGSSDNRSRILSCTLTVCFCHKCHWTGDAVAIWAKLTGEDMLSAAYSVCDHFHVPLPILS